MKGSGGRVATRVALLGGLIVILILIFGTLSTQRIAQTDTEQAVRSVSQLYLNELAGRREQVVASNLADNIEKIHVAVGLMTEDDLSDIAHLQAYQSSIKKLFDLEKFAFVDSEGLIYTSLGTQNNIKEYSFDYASLSKPEISILNLQSPEKKVVIAVPVDIPFGEKRLKVCFMEMDMDVMLDGVSMSQNSDATFCNIYTKDGIALSNTVLGGLAVEDNLLEAMRNATYEQGYSLQKFTDEFTQLKKGSVSFIYNGILETLSYVPVEGTDWLLTYLIQESVLSERISAVSGGIITRSLLQSLLTAFVLLGMFGFIIHQIRRNSKLMLEKETAEAENRVKQQEMMEKLQLQEKLLEEEKQRSQQEHLIRALAADYWSAYYIDLDSDDGVCYQAHEDLTDGHKAGEHFEYLKSMTDYANRYVAAAYREAFLRFVQPENLREELLDSRVISYRYIVNRRGREKYEMIRFAGVRHPEDRDDHLVHAVGACFTDVDAETRRTMAQNQALSDALKVAEEANKAKTAFLSNMSHEIRTPMNAIIGLDSIALNDKTISDKTRGYLEKIGASAHHLLGLINDILDMSRIESGRMTLKNEEFAFSKMLEQLNTMFSQQCLEKGLQYNCNIVGMLDDYYIGDNMKLKQVLINILGNAVKFTPEGGRVDFTVERTARYEGKTTIRFVVRDTGIGMSAEYLPHLFDAFTQEDSSTTSKYGSSGLGMAITKNIVDIMNGRIEVQSQKGVGTTFNVTVTLLDSKRSLSDSDAGKVNPSDMSVLVVDDDPVACEHGRLVLQKIGITSDIAVSGQEAIRKIRLRHARRQPYNLILIDWQMPELDGIATTREIRRITGDESAVIILTAYRWDDVYQEALDAGVDSFLSKPLFAQNVLDELEDAMSKKRQNSPLKPTKADLKGKRVLMAEDVQINAEIIMMVLKAREMQVELAENGKIAVEMFENHPAGYYDAILMDMRMPVMDGLEATAAIRDMDRSDARTIPIIALTANAFDEDVQRSLQAGLNAHLTKPVDPENLYDTLENLITE